MNLFQRVLRFLFLTAAASAALGQGGPGASPADLLKEETIRTRISDRVSGVEAIVEGRQAEGEGLLRRAARGDANSLPWRIDYNANLVRASRRLVESRQYQKAVRIAGTAMGNLDALIAELAAAAAPPSGGVRAAPALSTEERARLKARCLYLQGYLQERVLFKEEKAAEKYEAALGARPEAVGAGRALRRIPQRVRDRAAAKSAAGAPPGPGPTRGTGISTGN